MNWTFLKYVNLIFVTKPKIKCKNLSSNIIIKTKKYVIQKIVTPCHSDIPIFVARVTKIIFKYFKYYHALLFN